MAELCERCGSWPGECACGIDNPATLDGLFKEVHRWQLKTFPHATAASKVEHLRREVEELMADPTDEGEIADCLLLCIGIAMVQKKSIYRIVSEKLAVNKARKWGSPDANGVVEHIRQ